MLDSLLQSCSLPDGVSVLLAGACVSVCCVLCRRKKKWSGPLQYEDKSGQLMMLPGDMALLW